MNQVKNNTVILEKYLDNFQKNQNFKQLHYAFEIFSIMQILDDKELQTNEIEDSIVDGGNDGGIDSIVCFINDQYIYTKEQLEDFTFKHNFLIEINIIQIKYEDSFKEKLLNTIYTNLSSLFDLTIMDEKVLLETLNPRIVEKIILMKNLIIKTMTSGLNVKFNFSYATKANNIEANSVFNKKMIKIEKWMEKNFKGSKVEFNLFSAEQLIDIFHKPRKTNRELNFKDTPVSVSYKKIGEGYLGIVSLKDYYNFIKENDKLIVSIFDSDVRDWQGNIEVNKEIRKTIKDDYSRDFWWLNNGITVIASAYKQYGKSLYLENIQIVNGLQTSFEIANNYEKIEDDERSILVKVIITGEKNTIDKIIYASNNQTDIRPAILKATENIHRKIEGFFHSNGYYYERRKNYYRNLGIETKKIFNIQSTAQAFEAICNFNISTARSTPTKLIKDEKSYKNIFNENIDYKIYLNCCLIYRRVYDFILALESDNKNMMKNFSYHLARVLASFITNKSEYLKEDIRDINVESIQGDSIKSSYDFLRNFIHEYQSKNQDEIITNFAKIRKFDEELNKKLQEVLD